MSTANVASLMQQLAWELLKYEEADKRDAPFHVKKAIRQKIKEIEKKIEELKRQQN
jgi:hypothetical protein